MGSSRSSRSAALAMTRICDDRFSIGPGGTGLNSRGEEEGPPPPRTRHRASRPPVQHRMQGRRVRQLPRLGLGEVPGRRKRSEGLHPLDRPAHPGGVDLVDIDRVADAAEHRQRQPAAEVLAELLQALRTGSSCRAAPGGSGRSPGRAGSAGPGRRPRGEAPGPATSRPCRSPRRWPPPRRAGAGSRSSPRACAPTSGRSRAAGPRATRTGRRRG